MSNYKYWNVAAKGIAFDPQSGESFQLNETARQMLNWIKEGLSSEQISAEVARKWGIPYERALTDVLEFRVQLEVVSAA